MVGLSGSKYMFISWWSGHKFGIPTSSVQCELAWGRRGIRDKEATTHMRLPQSARQEWQPHSIASWYPSARRIPLDRGTHFRKHRGTITSAPTPSSINRPARRQACSSSSRYVNFPSHDATASASGVRLVTSAIVSWIVRSTRTKGFEFHFSI